MTLKLSYSFSSWLERPLSIVGQVRLAVGQGSLLTQNWWLKNFIYNEFFYEETCYSLRNSWIVVIIIDSFFLELLQHHVNFVDQNKIKTISLYKEKKNKKK